MNPGVGEFVQLTFTTNQIDLLKRCLRYVEVEDTWNTEGDKAILTQVQYLADFLDVVAEEPRAFPVTGRMATSIKTQNRRTKQMLKQMRKGLLA